ncbi:hypothetical protein L195_g053127, partial [Trifolium pratense]
GSLPFTYLRVPIFKVTLIKELERYLRNFIWSGDLLTRKMVTVAWNTVCTPIAEGGLGIRSFAKLNQASNLKLFWEFLNSDTQWAHILRSRVKRGSDFINHHVFSSIWSGIKDQANTILENTTWLLVNGC